MSDEGKLINYMDIYYIFSRAEKNSYLKGSVWLDMVLKLKMQTKMRHCRYQ